MTDNKTKGSGSTKLANVKVTRDDAAWEAEIKAEIPAELLAHYRTEALKEIKERKWRGGNTRGRGTVCDTARASGASRGSKAAHYRIPARDDRYA